MAEAAVPSKGKAMKRRRILAAAGLVVAGIAAKQTAQPVVAATLATGENDVTGFTALVAKTSWDPNSTTILTAQPAVPPPPGHATGVFGQGLGNGAGVVGLAATATIPSVLLQQGLAGVMGVAQGVTLTSTGSAAVLGTAAGTGNLGVYGVSGSGDGVFGESIMGYGGSFRSGKAPLRLEPSATAGAPTSGTHQAGELFVDVAGSLFYCKGAGSPGTWVILSTTPATLPVFTTLPTPERFVDTRIALGGLQGPVSGGTTRTFLMTGRAGLSGNPALIIPDSATVIVGNLTVVGAAGIPLGSYVTLWPGGAQPTVSNINFGPAGTTGAVANSYVVGLSVSGGHGQVSVFNLSPCDYILDVTGYYVGQASAAGAKA